MQDNIGLMHQRIRRFMRILLQQAGFRSANSGNTTFLQSTYQKVKAGKSFMNKFLRLHAYCCAHVLIEWFGNTPGANKGDWLQRNALGTRISNSAS